MSEPQTLLEVENLTKHFPIRKGLLKTITGHVRAVDGVSFTVREGEKVGLVGESGCGKTTTGRCVIRLIEPTSGSIRYRRDNGLVDLMELEPSEMKQLRRELQVIFQDPFSSLDPRMSVRDIIAEPLRIQRMGSRTEHTERVRYLLNRVGLSDHHMNRYPHEFSGGQRQRIGIARALALNPRFIVCDEPVSALDVSVQAQVLNLLAELQQEFGLSLLFVAHNLSVIEYVSDRVIVMYLGKIAEVATARDLYTNPRHPYTEALLGSIPEGDPRVRKVRQPLQGTVPDPSNPPQGCHFNTRCPYAQDICFHDEPPLVDVDDSGNHQAACHFSDELELRNYQAFRQPQAGSK
jgi:oligopeptide/dipeptide ABC transporter ATP-binding protein